MRELGSWIRLMLAAPMGGAKRDALKPTFSHKTQIERITGRLGFAADSEVTNLWIS